MSHDVVLNVTITTLIADPKQTKVYLTDCKIKLRKYSYYIYFMHSTITKCITCICLRKVCEKTELQCEQDIIST